MEFNIQSIPVLSCNTAVVGAGAAGFNAADELHKRGVDVLLLADSLHGGTSRNAGSDKQTYYKLSLSGDRPDSIGAMAQSFYAGGGTHGDHAYAMAANSVRCFMKLLQLGVRFPYNEWGEYVGYQTDHDQAQRATSVGPLTSRNMVEVLERSCRARGVRMREKVRLCSLLSDDQGKFIGLLMLDRANKERPWLLINARNVVLCTGGAANAYKNVVFPKAQHGATGLVLRSGIKANNLCYWQYGLASIKVRWNVSGSYQQALPRYTDGENEILLPFFDSEADALDSVFLKGYQWPFDARKTDGSSRVDIAVHTARKQGKRVFMDFTREHERNPLVQIGSEAKDYLQNCNALIEQPIDRLARINPKAIDFYRSRGIDLYTEPLEVALCAQHSNGGFAIDEWWQTNLSGVYAAGECAGAFGVYRPGGSALNETQVGSLRAAQHIAAHSGEYSARSVERFIEKAADAVQNNIRYFEALVGESSSDQTVDQLQTGMDEYAGALRDVEMMKKMLEVVNGQIEAPKSMSDLETVLDYIDVLYTQQAALSAMICQAQYKDSAGHAFTQGYDPTDNASIMDYAFETVDGYTEAVPVRPLPDGGGWFEDVWKRFGRGEVYG